MKLLLALIASLFVSSASAQGLTSHCYTTNGLNCVPAVAAAYSAKISIASGTTTEIVPLLTGKQIYVTSFDLVTTAANTFKFVYGTGTACATGTTDLTGAYGLTTFSVVTKGNGMGAVLFVPAGNALCAVTSTSAQTSGSVSYSQF